MMIYSPASDDNDPPREMAFSLVFAIAAPVLAVLSAMLGGATRNDALAMLCAAVAVAHAVVSVLYGMSGLQRADTEERTCGALALTAVSLLLASFTLFVWLVTMPVTVKLRGAPNQNCENNMKLIGVIAKMYANDRDHALPPLSVRPGELALSFGHVVPEYLTDTSVFICRQQPGLHFYGEIDSPHFELISDQNYLYFGYIIDSPETLQTFRNAYENVLAEGGNFEADLPVEPGRGTWGGDTILRLTDDPDVLRTYFDQQTAVSGVRNQADIPILVERPGRHFDRFGSPACNVLYMDGHVERHRYPGEWPLTEKAMKTLLAIDQLGPHIAPDAVTSHRPSIPLAFFWLLPFPFGIGAFILWRRWGFTIISVLGVYMAMALTILIVLLVQPKQPELPLEPVLPVIQPDGTTTYVQANAHARGTPRF